MNLKRAVLAIFAILFSLGIKAQTYSGLGDTVPDTGIPIQFSINVSGLVQSNLNGIHGLKTVCLNITHPYVGDLKAKIISPDGSSFSLFSQVGGGGQDFIGTCFDSSATTSIAAGSAPFAATFKPIGNIGHVNNNQNGNGIWKIELADVASADTGKLVNWSLTFAANAPTPTIVNTNIPLVVIQSNGNNISQGPKVLANMKIIDNGIGNLNNIADIGNVYSGNIGVRIRGSFSASLPQKPYSVELYGNTTNIDTSISLLGMPAESDWILQATYNDRSFVRNKLMYHIWDEMGHYATRSRYCEVIVDNEYMGVYLLMEKIKRDDDRISISKLQPSDTTGDQLTGGYIISHDYFENGWGSNYSPLSCPTRFYDFNYIYPKVQNIVPQQGNYIKNFFDDIENRLYGTNPNDSLLGYKAKIHLNSFADYMLANEMAWNGDGYKKSMYFWKDRDSVDKNLHAGPIWDFDWALKRMPWTPTDYSGWYYKVNPCDGDVLFLPWWDIMMKDTIFENVSRCRWEYHRQHSLHFDTINSYIDQQAAYLQQAQVRHFNAWQTLNTGTGTPELTAYPTTLAIEIDTLKSTIKQRILWIDANLGGNCDTLIAVEPSGIHEKEILSLKVSPNPTTEAIQIHSTILIDKVCIVDITGKQYYVESIKPNKYFSLKVDNLSNGIYILKAYSNNQLLTNKFLKQ
jgi:subtilisin-like proprotein convertase family protein